MEPPLTGPQQALYAKVQQAGAVKKGEGYSLNTARALSRRALITLEERRDASGAVHFWRARSTRPATTPRPGGFVLRTAVRNPATACVTYTAVHHLPDAHALHEALIHRGATEPAGRGLLTGSHMTENQALDWAPLPPGHKEFVCAGNVYRLRPCRPDGWEAVMLPNTVVATGNDPDEVEQRARADAAAFYQATKG